MSSILKALQKLERERETRQGKPANIKRGILREDRRLRSGRAWQLFLSISITALVAALLTYTLTGKRGEKPAVSVSKRIETARETTLQPPSRPAAAKEESLPPVIRRAPSPEIATIPAKSQPPEQQMQLPAPVVGQQQPIAPAPNSKAVPSQPTLNVAGIGWREERASRMAVINGSSVGEGALVDGVKVEEIFPDRVRFSYEKKLFDVPVGKSVSPR